MFPFIKIENWSIILRVSYNIQIDDFTQREYFLLATPKSPNLAASQSKTENETSKLHSHFFLKEMHEKSRATLV